MIVTRILEPDAFALVGLTGSIIFLFELVSDSGARSFILKHEKGNDTTLVNCVWTFGLLRSFVLFTIFLLMAEPIGSWLEIQDLSTALIITSPIFLLHGLRSLAPYLEDRRNRPARPILLEFLANLIATAIIIVSTLILESKWCMVVGLIYQPVLHVIFTHTLYQQPKIRFTFDKDIFIEILNWAKYIIPSSIITIIIFQGDKIIYGKMFTPEMLGFYYLASNFSRIPAGYIVNFSRRLVGPAMSEAIHGNDKDLKRTYYKSKNIILTLYAIALGLATGTANLIITIIYDDRYLAVGTFASILFVRSFLFALSHPLESFLVVRGKIRTTLIANVLRLIWVLITIYPFYSLLGSMGIVIAFVTMELPAVLFTSIASYRDGFYNFRIEAFYVLVFLTFAILGRYLENFILHKYF